MGNALRALVLLACSAAALVCIRTGPDGWAFAVLLIATVVVPFIMAVIVAWRGHDR